jgi:transposase-like protein
VINDLSDGKFKSISAAAKHYGINKYETVVKWLRQAGKGYILPKIVIIDLEKE